MPLGAGGPQQAQGSMARLSSGSSCAVRATGTQKPVAILRVHRPRCPAAWSILRE